MSAPRPCGCATEESAENVLQLGRGRTDLTMNLAAPRVRLGLALAVAVAVFVGVWRVVLRTTGDYGTPEQAR
jgi:hypothetical protein